MTRSSRVTTFFLDATHPRIRPSKPLPSPNSPYQFLSFCTSRFRCSSTLPRSLRLPATVSPDGLSEVFSIEQRRGGTNTERLAYREARLISGFSVVTIRRCVGNSLATEELIVDFTNPHPDDLHHQETDLGNRLRLSRAMNSGGTRYPNSASPHFGRRYQARATRPQWMNG